MNVKCAGGLYIDSIQSCADELSALLRLVPAEATIHFRGEYFGVGPKPLEVIDLLIERNMSFTSFYRTTQDREFLLALGLIPESPRERLRWINPYSGTIHAFECYGGDGIEILRGGSQANIDKMKDLVIARGHFEFWKTLASKPEELLGLPWSATGCAYGEPLVAFDFSGEIVASYSPVGNYSTSFFLPWLAYRLEKAVGVGDLVYG